MVPAPGTQEALEELYTYPNALGLHVGVDEQVYPAPAGTFSNMEPELHGATEFGGVEDLVGKLDEQFVVVCDIVAEIVTGVPAVAVVPVGHEHAFV